MPLKWTDLAGLDLDKIEAYIAKENSSVIAVDMVMRIVDSVYLILPDHPKAGRQGRLKNTPELVISELLLGPGNKIGGKCRPICFIVIHLGQG